MFYKPRKSLFVVVQMKRSNQALAAELYWPCDSTEQLLVAVYVSVLQFAPLPNHYIINNTDHGAQVE